MVGKIKGLLALVEDFRTFEWVKTIPYPEEVFQKTEQYLQILN